MAVSRGLPLGTEAGFSSYKEMKKYWKNMYGYRLPETDYAIFYVQVHFKLIGPKLFTYPLPSSPSRMGAFSGHCDSSPYTVPLPTCNLENASSSKQNQ